MIRKNYFSGQKVRVEVPGDSCDARLVVRGDARPQGSQGDQPVQRTAFQIMKTEFPGDPPRDGALAGCRRSVDRDDGSAQLRTKRASAAKYSG